MIETAPSDYDQLVASLRSGSVKVRPIMRTSRTMHALERLQEQADARISAARPFTYEDRLQGFRMMGYTPGGLFVPDDPDSTTMVREKVRELGRITDPLERSRQYRTFQAFSESWYQEGVPGKWTWQQAVARSMARFRIVAWGRRGGKTFAAAREALAFAFMRPRSWIWCAAATNGLVGRVFDMIVTILKDMGYSPRNCPVWRDTDQTKQIVLPNGSKIEGISLNDPKTAAGTGIDLVIVDEAEHTTRQAWTGQILPTLADKNGQAIIISSTQISDSWFWEEVENIRDLGAEAGDWEAFTGASWQNFFNFPQGRESKAIQEALKQAEDPAEFLATYGGIPSAGRERVYDSYKEQVHSDQKAVYLPGKPVIVVVDPSAGRNEYAVGVFQDYGDWVAMIDEYYEAGPLAEEVAAVLDKRPWRKEVRECRIDPGWPAEITRWQQAGWPASPIMVEGRDGQAIEAKPEVVVSIPIVRKMLRDPARFAHFYTKVREQVLEDWVSDGSELSVREERMLAIEIEERLSDANLTDDDVAMLRECARLKFNPSNANVKEEIRKYRYRKSRSLTADDQEKPIKRHDHLMDIIRYYCWLYKRDLFVGDTMTYLEDHASPDGFGEYQGTNWLEQTRIQMRTSGVSVSYLEELDV